MGFVNEKLGLFSVVSKKEGFVLCNLYKTFFWAIFLIYFC